MRLHEGEIYQVVPSLLFGVTLIAQFTVSKYVPVLYWLNVMLVIVVGTLVTDSLVDEVGVELWVSVFIFNVLMLATFSIWFYLEKTLSIRIGHGWWAMELPRAWLWDIGKHSFCLLVRLHRCSFYTKCTSWATFWHFGLHTSSLGSWAPDLLSQDTETKTGGLGLAIFLALIAVDVGYLSYSKLDAPSEEDEAAARNEENREGRSGARRTSGGWI
jgi:uncharacterized membrane-anchored protein